ncbi:MAG: TetR/AcrR family transcriptional regulator [Deltaproteobacteria bacterium]|nr:TetR/AcrR family transcriptional regulator [Deltaproteobacteria bacterium]
MKSSASEKDAATGAPGSGAVPRVRMSRGQRREAILECATRQFARSGYANTTVNGIAAELGVTEPLIYKHFDSKEALFREVFQRVALFFVERIGEVVSEGASPLSTLRKIALFYYQHLDAHPEFAAILYQVAANSAEGIEGLKEPLRFFKKIFLQLHDAIEALLKEAKRQGEVPEALNESAAAWAFIGNYHILILLKSFEVGDFNPLLIDSMLSMVTGRVGAA